MRGWAQRLTIVVFAGTGLVLSLLWYADERQARVPVETAVTGYGLDVRRPAEVEALRLQPAADLRASFLADMTLADVYGSVPLSNVSAEERAAWLRSLTTLDGQIATARDLSLDALARRPGWAFHHASAGLLEYSLLRRESLQLAADRSVRWETPIRSGMRLAPGNVSYPAYLAGAYIETWGGVEHATDPREVIRQASSSPVFVARNYRLVGMLLGREEAIGLLPDKPDVLRIAFARETRDGNATDAAVLRTRIDAAEREARAAGLEEIRERALRRDTWGQRSAASQWAARHRPEELDDERGRREAAEVLALWPSTRHGSWLRDPRAGLVRYFLSGREDFVDGAVLAAVIERMSDVPPPVRARILALAGRAWEADQIVRSAPTKGSFEWTPVLVDLARGWVEAGKREQAVDAISRMAPAARDECNVLLLRRGLEDGEADARLRALAAEPLTRNGAGAISACFDPSIHATSVLRVSIESPSASLVSYGWEGGRIGSVLVEGSREIDVPLSGIVGRHAFRIQTEAGTAARIAGASIGP